jgi:hypothetical protein
MAIILQGKINESKCADPTTFAACAFGGYAIFWTGISVGFSNLFCGYNHKHTASASAFREVDAQ